MGGEIFAQTLTVKGQIHTSDSLMILFGDGINIDTLISSNGKFHFQRSMKHPELLTIVAIKSKSNEYVKKDFFVGEGEVALEAKFKELNAANIKMTDTKSQFKYNEFRKRFNPLVKVARSIIDSSYVKGKIEVEKAVYRNLYNRIVEVESEVAEEFVRENTDNIVGAFVLANYLQENDPKEINEIIQLFNEDLLTSKYLLKVKDRIIAQEQFKEGEMLPEFSLRAQNGDEISEKDLLRKYSILDFWGSWCAPCIAGMPKMKEYYKKYSDKFNFIGIACNDDEKSWNSAIKVHQLDWPQYLNSSQEVDLAHKFQINTFPTKIIISPDGKILKIFKGESEEFYHHIDQISSKIK